METVTIHSPLHQFKSEAKIFRQMLKGPFSYLNEEGSLEVVEGVEVSHGHALEMLSILSGAKSWKSLRAKLTDEPSKKVEINSLNLESLLPNVENDHFFFVQLDREIRSLAGLPNHDWLVWFEPESECRFVHDTDEELVVPDTYPDYYFGHFFGYNQESRQRFLRGVEFIIDNYVLSRLMNAVDPTGGYAPKGNIDPEDFYEVVGCGEVTHRYTQDLLAGVWKEKTVGDVYSGLFRDRSQQELGQQMANINALLLHLGYNTDPGWIANAHLPEGLIPPPHWKTLEESWKSII